MASSLESLGGIDWSRAMQAAQEPLFPVFTSATHELPPAASPEERDERAGLIINELVLEGAMPEWESLPPDSPDYTN